MKKVDPLSNLSNNNKDALKLSEVNDTPKVIDDENAFFRLSEVIVRDYLKLDKDSSFIQQRGIQVLNKLENFYEDEDRCPNDKSEKAFILRSLPLISSVVQLSTTIKNFNDAMEEIQKQYEIEDNPFEQATKLSYLVFTFAIDRGSQLCLQGNDSCQLWKQMRNQIAIGLLKSRLTIKGKSLGYYWYDSAFKYAEQVISKAEESQKIKNSTKAAQKLRQAIFINHNYEDIAKSKELFNPIWYYLAQQYAQQINSKQREIEITKTESWDRSIKDRETKRIKKEIEDVRKKAVKSLEEAIQLNSDNKRKATNEKNTTFEPIKDDEEFNNLIKE